MHGTNEKEHLEELLQDLVAKVDALQAGLTSADAVMTRTEAAEYLRCHPQTLYNWAVRDGLIAYSQLGDRGGLRFRQKDLDAFLERHRIAESEFTYL